MVQNWIMGMVVSFVMRQLAKWGKSIDWAMVKADVDARVRALVPGEWLDDEAVQMAHALVDALAGVLGANAILEKIVMLLLDKKFQDAWSELRDLIMKYWKPTTEAEKKLMSYVEGLEVLG